MKPLNIVRRVTMRAGWIGFFSGESQGKAMERVIPELHGEGYRVAFVIKDQWSLARKLLALVVLVITLDIVGPLRKRPHRRRTLRRLRAPSR